VNVLTVGVDRTAQKKGGHLLSETQTPRVLQLWSLHKILARTFNAVRTVDATRVSVNA
jgi:hypothetical protein